MFRWVTRSPRRPDQMGCPGLLSLPLPLLHDNSVETFAERTLDHLDQEFLAAVRSRDPKRSPSTDCGRDLKAAPSANW